MKETLKPGDIVEGTHGKMKVVEDFLPRPEDLVTREPEAERVSITLDKDTVEWFKEQAKKLGANYQPMIRKLLREYVLQQSQDDKNLST
jgi:uncharacterized protein (DUF4415 family)